MNEVSGVVVYTQYKVSVVQSNLRWSSVGLGINNNKQDKNK